MPPRLKIRPLAGNNRASLPKLSSKPRPSVCFFCSLSARPARNTRQPRQELFWLRRATSTQAAPGEIQNRDLRKDLREALLELQKHAGNHVNLSRLQLALRGLQQEAGKESIRVAILGVANGSTGRSAKEVLRLMLADPLAPEEEWERQLEKHDTAQPMVVRVGREQATADQHHILEITKDNPLPEINVSSTALNGHNIEILVMEANFANTQARDRDFIAFEEEVLVPSVEIPTSTTGRHTPVTTPVHKALIVADGILGATSVVTMPSVFDKDEIATAVNLKIHVDDTSSCPFITVDVDSGSEALAAIRQGVEHAMKYESLWFKSNVPDLLDWLKLGALDTKDGTTKPTVRRLISSVLRNALVDVQTKEAEQLSNLLKSKTSVTGMVSLNQALADWAERAHAELRDQLDVAFTSRRWRKLGWWKLFWRVDDVSMLSAETVSRRFLPGAEQEVIYLAGRISEAAREMTGPTRYSLPAVATRAIDVSGSGESTMASLAPPSPEAVTTWPTQIPFTKKYLLDETVPALQALAQKLVLQTVGTSTTSTALAALMYLSSFGAYEAGAVGALGLVWSLGRMQKKWETAREFWEGEVREEGRKAVRAVEASIARVLDGIKEPGNADTTQQELRVARELLRKAEDALARLR